MAVVTLSSIRTEVRERGDFPLSRKFTDAFMDREIQKAWASLHRIVEEVNEGYWDKDGTVSTVAGQRFVAMPSEVWKLKGVDLLDGGEYRTLDQVQISDRNRYRQQADKPEAYRTSERGLELYPTPDAVYALRLTYARRVVALGAVALEIDDEWSDYVIWSAILAIATSEERPTGDYAQAVGMAESAIRKSASGRRQAEPEYLVLREHGPEWGWW